MMPPAYVLPPSLLRASTLPLGFLQFVTGTETPPRCPTMPPAEEVEKAEEEETLPVDVQPETPPG